MAEVYPVVHVKSEGQAVDQASVALEAGADGVYLIDHKSDDIRTLMLAFERLRAEQPEAFIGLNFLQFDLPVRVFDYLKNAVDNKYLASLPDAVWADDAWRSRGRTQELRCTTPLLRSISYLGGVAFKGNLSYTDDPVKAAAEANSLQEYVDVVVTSGAGTGQAPPLAKLTAMKQVIIGKPLAVASGLSSQNVGEYAGLIDQILVASSIETEPGSGVFDSDELRRFVELASDI